MAFIFEKLDLGNSRARAGSIISIHSRITTNPRKTSNTLPIPIAGLGVSGRRPSATDSAITNEESELVYPEDALELLCGDRVVDPRITLATLKQYYGGGGDMLLHYRPRQGVTVQQ